MPSVICLLRGVNVGGNNQIRMEALRSLCESLNLRKVQTYIQSGNVVFSTAEKNLEALALRIGTAIEKAAGFRPDAMLRTADELRGVIARNPFAGREGIEPGKLLVLFLGSEPGVEAREKIASLQGVDNEELRLIGRELYVYFPVGQGKSKLSFAPLDRRAAKITWTGRNWNTVTKLLEMAEASDG